MKILTQVMLFKTIFTFCWIGLNAAPTQDTKSEGVKKFSCIGKVIGGYYADVADNCQTFHVCTLGENSTLNDIVIPCLEGTVFDQKTRVCERIEEVNCAISEDYYHLNNDLYGPGIIPVTAADTAQSKKVTTELHLDPLKALMGMSSSSTSPSPKIASDTEEKPNNNAKPKIDNKFTSRAPVPKSKIPPSTTPKPQIFSLPILKQPVKVSHTVSSTSISASVSTVNIQTPLSHITFNRGKEYNPSLPVPHLRPSLLKIAAQRARDFVVEDSVVEAQTPANFVDVPRLVNRSSTKSINDWKRTNSQKKRSLKNSELNSSSSIVLPLSPEISSRRKRDTEFLSLTKPRTHDWTHPHLRINRLDRQNSKLKNDNIYKTNRSKKVLTHLPPNKDFINHVNDFSDISKTNRQNTLNSRQNFRFGQNQDPSLSNSYNRRTIRPTNSLRLSPTSRVKLIWGKDINNKKTDNDKMIQKLKYDKKKTGIPISTFSCKHKKEGTLYADRESGCILFHLCYKDSNNRLLQATFLCDSGLIFDQASGKCKPAKDAKCYGEQNPDTGHLCSKPSSGIGKAYFNTHCRFYTRTLMGKKGEIIHSIPCLCPSGYAFSDSSQMCQKSEAVKCYQSKTISEENDSELIRNKRETNLRFLNDIALNVVSGSPREEAALDKLADLVKWAEENANKSLFIDMYELHDGSLEEYPKKSKSGIYSPENYQLSNRFQRKKRSPSTNSSSANNSTNADVLNSLINVTSLDPEKKNKTPNADTQINTNVKNISNETNNQTNTNETLVESISKPSSDSDRKNEAIVVSASKTSLQGTNSKNSINKPEKPLNEGSEDLISSNKDAEPFIDTKLVKDKSDIGDADMIETTHSSNISKIIEESKDKTESISTTTTQLATTTTQLPKTTTHLSTSTTEKTTINSTTAQTAAMPLSPNATSSLVPTEISNTTEATKQSVQPRLETTPPKLESDPNSNTTLQSENIENRNVSMGNDSATTSLPTTTLATITSNTTTNSPELISNTTLNITDSVQPNQNVTSTPSTTVSEILTSTNASTTETTLSSTAPPSLTTVDLPETSFTCKGKKLEQFYPDPEANCQAFHYCSPGFADNQVLDLKFLCNGATKFDLKSQKCIDMDLVKCEQPEVTTSAPPVTTQSTTISTSTITSSTLSSTTSIKTTTEMLNTSTTEITSTTPISTSTSTTTELPVNTTLAANNTTIAITTTTEIPKLTNSTSPTIKLENSTKTINESLVSVENSTSSVNISSTVTPEVQDILETTPESIIEETSESVEPFTEIPITDETPTEIVEDSEVPSETMPTTETVVEEQKTITPKLETVTEVNIETPIKDTNQNKTNTTEIPKKLNEEEKVRSKVTVTHSVSAETQERKAGVTTFSISRQSS